MYHVEYSPKKVLGWLRPVLVFTLIWIVIAQFGLPPAQLLIAYVAVCLLAALAWERLVAGRKRIERTLCTVESRNEEAEAEIKRFLATIATQQEDIMAIGNETKAALTELREAISTEADQAVEKIIAATNADAATAEAIREAVEGVKGIIPDAVEETEIPTVDAPVDEPAPETPVDEPVEGDEA